MDAQLQRRLLHIARQAIASHLQGRDDSLETLDAEPWSDPTPRGVFVTLRRDERLRGCIGTFSPQQPLPATVREMAIAAAHDPRFVNVPVTIHELPRIRIELSVLSPLERTADPLSLQVGRHGIYVRSRNAAGCFLPEVATEFGWDAAEFLSRCCEEKAHMAADAWKHPDTQVYLFTVEKIEEPV